MLRYGLPGVIAPRMRKKGGNLMPEASVQASPDTLQDFRSKARSFIASDIAAKQHVWAERKGVGKDVWEKAGGLGLVSPDLSTEYGGGGHDFSFFAALLEERAYLDDRSWGISNQAIVVQYLLHHGTDGQKQRYLPELASGRMLAAIAMTEPHTGSDLKSIETRAVRVNSGYRLDGVKTFISHVRDADLIVVAARTDNQGGARDVSLLLVETAECPGFRIRRHLPKIGQTGLDTSEIEFDSVMLPDTAVLGGVEGRGFHQMMQDLPYERMIVTVSGIATMERAFQLAADYARERIVFGKPLIAHQNTRFKLAAMKTECTVGRAFVQDCIRKLAEGTLDSTTASCAKLWVSEAEGRVVDEALQLFGGRGYTTDYPIAQIFIDSRVERIYGGTSEIMKEIIARSI